MYRLRGKKLTTAVSKEAEQQTAPSAPIKFPLDQQQYSAGPADLSIGSTTIPAAHS